MLVQLTVGLVLSLTALSEASAQAGSPGAVVVSPSGGMSADNFGRLVDVSGHRLIVADDTEVWIYDQSTQSFEASELLAEAFAVPVFSVQSVSLDGDVAAVSCTTETTPGGALLPALAVFGFDGASWSVLWTSLTSSTPSFISLASAVHDEHVYSIEQIFGAFCLRVWDLEENAEIVACLGSKTSQLVAFAVGDGRTPESPTRVLISIENNLRLRLVASVGVSGLVQTDFGFVTVGEASDDYAAALAVDDGWMWLSAPEASGVSQRAGRGTEGAGRLELWEARDSGEFTFVDAFDGPADGAHWGRALAMQGDVLLFSEARAPLLKSNDAGAVHAARFDGESWSLSGEVHHALDTANTLHFGADLALDGSLMVVGEPRGEREQGAAWWRPLPAESVFANDLVAGIAGFGGEAPMLSVTGATFSGAAFRVDVSEARPRSPAVLVVGLSAVSLPFKSGVLLPAPDLLFLRATDASGAFAVPGRWPTPGVAGGELFLQAFVADVDAPAGYAATPGFSAVQF